MNGILSKRSQVEPGEAEAFSGMSGMVEGHARCARGLKPRALARGVGSFCILIAGLGTILHYNHPSFLSHLYLSLVAKLDGYNCAKIL